MEGNGKGVAPVVALAASAGGLNCLAQILAGLPPDFAAPVLVVLHLAPNRVSVLPSLLARRTRLRVEAARDGADLREGVVYVAPPDHHLRIDAERRIRLTETHPVHHARPAADELFWSLAEACGRDAVGVICSGTGCDGSEGLAAIRAGGGTTIAQDRATSEYFGMPGEAIRLGAAAQVLPLSQIAGRLVELVGTAPPVTR